jgi:hypothetical protein
MLSGKPSFSIRMNIDKPTSFNIHPTIQPLVNPVIKPTIKPPVSLKAPMIDRVFNVRPGCGSCGK